MSDKAINVTVREGSSPTLDPPTNETFFSWIRDEESKNTPIQKARSVPWMGLVALILSALTSILSGVVLIIIDGKKTWPKDGIYKAMQPASWLSALISANSIFLHIALSEGVTVAWWFRATRETATIKDLHRVWATGTSASSALMDLKTLNYVSLATIFVAIIPLNGFLLQGALSTPVKLLNTTQTIDIPMVKQLEAGYSGYTTNGTVGVGIMNQTTWPTVFQQVQNSGASSYSQYAYFGNYDQSDGNPKNLTLNEELYHDKLNTDQAVWQAVVPGAGFEYSCVKSTIAYDMFPHDSNTNYSANLFGLNFTWNKTDPNTIFLNTYWKDNSACAGVYQVRNCTLRAATVEYPVQLELNVSQAVAGPYYSLQAGTSREDDKVVRILEPYADEGKYNTTFGGIWLLLNSWYGGTSKIFNYTQSGHGSSSSAGPFAESLQPNYEQNWYSNAPYMCNLTVNWGIQNLGYFKSFNAPNVQTNSDQGWLYYPLYNADVADVILDQVRQAMFLASVYSGSQWYTDNYLPDQFYDYDASGTYQGWTAPYDQDFYVQSVDANRYVYTTVYEVRWYLWGASLALTYLIILVVLPTFWGFWVLARKPTMSPVDVARAFNAPVVSVEQAHQMRVDALIKEVGSRPIHPRAVVEEQSLPPSQDTSRLGTASTTLEKS